jgi:hypothetical protein
MVEMVVTMIQRGSNWISDGDGWKSEGSILESDLPLVFRPDQDKDVQRHN